MGTLPHSCFEVGKVERSASPDVPNQVVPVPTLESRSPSATEDRVHFPGEKRRRIKCPNGEWYVVLMLDSIEW